MSGPLLRLEAVTVRYADKTVLDVPDLVIECGVAFALVGPSGAGKSTLLRLLNLLEAPTAGRILFDGTPVHADTAPLSLRRRVTTVFQRPALLSGTVLHNVVYGLGLRGTDNAQRRAMEALEQVGLADAAQQPARTLSGGQMQRVALARAMVLQPDVLLLDEPTANLDPYNVQVIERTVVALHGQGTTVVLVTHNLFQARRLAQQVALLLDGRVVEVADTATFFDNPRDSRTAAFVRGDMIW